MTNDSTQTPAQRLDNILKRFISLKDKNYKGLFSAFVSIDKTDDTLKEVQMILDKLIKDGYIVKLPEKESNSNDFLSILNSEYELTFDGLYFMTYYKGYEASINKQDRKDCIENTKYWLLITGTWFTGLGAVGLVLWEMYDKGFFDSCR